MKFEVETTSLQTTVSNLESQLKNLETIQTALYKALESLDGTWTGPAHDTFAGMYAQDQLTLEQLRNTLTTITADLAAARSDYDNCEDSVAAAIRRISV